MMTQRGNLVFAGIILGLVAVSAASSLARAAKFNTHYTSHETADGSELRLSGRIFEGSHAGRSYQIYAPKRLSGSNPNEVHVPLLDQSGGVVHFLKIIVPPGTPSDDSRMESESKLRELVEVYRSGRSAIAGGATQGFVSDAEVSVRLKCDPQYGSLYRVYSGGDHPVHLAEMATSIEGKTSYVEVCQIVEMSGVLY